MRRSNQIFRELFGGGQRVEIPVIQRNYAQGREDEHSREVRARFLKALGEALSPDQANNEPLDLDFVYGRWRSAERTLEPLDGQQRLTTLFLLHWYLAALDDAFEEFQSWMTAADGGSCFTYRTRPAAREFFDELVRRPAPVTAFVSQGRALSDWMIDAAWFVRSWLRDPTVRGCLTMLDAIHDRFAASDGTWARLVSRESPTVVFRLLRLEDFNLSDDLYVKMNARGKTLTRFEIFKAEFERFVIEKFGDERCPHEPAIRWREYVGHQFDGAWTDFLWRHRGGTIDIDSRFMHLIRALAVVRCVNRDDDANLAGQVEGLLANAQPGLPVYEELGCLEAPFIEELVSVLDTFARHEEAPEFLGRADYLNEQGLFRRVLVARPATQDDGLTLVDWVMFYAWCCFLVRFSKDLRSEAVRGWFHEWIRIVVNLAENSSIDRTERLVAGLRGLRELSMSCGRDFLSRIASGALEESGGFNQQQQREERLKAQLILHNANWRPLIEQAETHPYFRGDIEFLLRFSGVFDRMTAAGRCDWSDDEDERLRQSFADWYERACAVFPTGMAGLARFPEFLWERALLATGDYMLPRGRNWSFLDDRDRDASWKRLLRGDTRVLDRETRRDVVRRVLAQVDPKNTVSSLRAIVAAGVQGDDAAPLLGFRKRLVLEPRLIEYCELRMVRLEEDSAFLLRRVQRNGYHVDLYVYDLYLRLHSRRTDLAPFDKIERPDVIGTYPPSRLVIRTPLGLALTAEKRGPLLELTLQLPEPSSRVVSCPPDWTAEGESIMRRSVPPDTSEEAILELVAFLRALPFNAPTTSTAAEQG